MPFPIAGLLFLAAAALPAGSFAQRLQILESEVIFHSINPNYQPMKYTERDLVWMYPVGLTQKVEL